MTILYDNSKLGKKYYKMYVRDNDGNIIGTGTGSSKQRGEKIAAKHALQNLDVIPIDNEQVILDPTSSIIYHKKIFNKENNIQNKENLSESSKNKKIKKSKVNK